MTKVDAAATYEQRARAIHLASQPIPDDFERWLEHAGWSEQTIRDHVDNIRFFTNIWLGIPVPGSAWMRLLRVMSTGF